MTEGQENITHEDELGAKDLEWARSDDVKEGLRMILSHHPPSLYGHCLRISVRGHSLYLCGRCTGIYGGLALGLLMLFLFDIALAPSWLWFLISVAIGFSTVVDWMSQRLTPRKTTNTIRAVTGFCSGIGLAIIFYLGNVLYMLVALAVMSVSIGLVGLIENRRRSASLAAQRAEIDAEDSLDDDGHEST
ncbi:MAG: hypothetical protein C4K48_07310 [Candidatus Thorarchaeota archaeon]|nr:MAG: hypothetical protein C4K48_07310 [Candidatus Thorarchaeota archaeon]